MPLRVFFDTRKQGVHHVDLQVMPEYDDRMARLLKLSGKWRVKWAPSVDCLQQREDSIYSCGEQPVQGCNADFPISVTCTASIVKMVDRLGSLVVGAHRDQGGVQVANQASAPFFEYVSPPSFTDKIR